MKKINTLLSAVFLVLIQAVCAQDKQEAAVLEYIARYKDLAIAEMKRTGVPAAIKLAQGIHETGAGTSELVLKSNNHFGIKCKNNWKGQKVKHTDDAPNECFRKYSSAEDSYKDHSDFLKNSPRYASLFLLDPTNFSGWAYGLKKAGYATNPRYPEIIIRLIENYRLQDYTFIALGQKTADGEILAKTEVTGDKKTELVFTDLKEKTAEETDERQLFGLSESEPAYPSGEFKINETRVIFVKKGTSFLSIAAEYNLPLNRIFEFNDMKPHDFSQKDQLIYIQRKRKTGNNATHVVKEGETIHDIAQREAIRIESLLEYNSLTRNSQLVPGEVLYLHKKSAQPAPTGKN